MAEFKGEWCEVCHQIAIMVSHLMDKLLLCLAKIKSERLSSTV